MITKQELYDKINSLESIVRKLTWERNGAEKALEIVIDIWKKDTWAKNIEC